MSQIDKWKEARRPGKWRRGKKNPDHAQLHDAPTLPKSSTVHDLRVEGDIDLSIFDDLQPDQDFMIMPTAPTEGQVYTVAIDENSGRQVVQTTDAATIAVTSDGVTPTTAPSDIAARTTGNAIIVTWTGVSNADPVTYEVHAIPDAERTSRGGASWVPDAASKVGEIQGLIYTVRAWPIGITGAAGHTYPDYDEPVYIRVVARDEDGVDYGTAVSAEVVSSFLQVNHDDIFAGSISADLMVADEAFFDMVSAALLAGNELIIGDRSSQHIRATASGMQLIESDGTVKVDLPTGSDDPAIFRGVLIADQLSVLESATIQGVLNKLDAGAVLTVNSTQGDPSISPELSDTMETGQTLSGSPISTHGGSGYFYDSTNDTIWRKTSKASNGQVYVQEFDYATGAYIRQRNISTLDVPFATSETGGGVVRQGDYVWVLVYGTDFASIDGYQMVQLNESDLTLVSTTDLDSLGLTRQSGSGIADYAGTSIAVGDFTTITSSGQPRIQFFSPTLLTFTSTLNLSGGAGYTAASGANYQLLHSGSEWWLAFRNTGDEDYVDAYDDSTGAKLSDEFWYLDTSVDNKLCGLMEIDSQFWFCRSPNTDGPVLRKTTSFLAGATADYLHLAYRWDNAGTHTKVSSISSMDVSRFRRHRIQITVPTPPSGCSSQIFALSTTSTPPAVTSLKRQTATSYINLESGTSIYLSAYDSSGTALGTDSNTFGAGAASLTSAGTNVSGDWELSGDGRLVLPRVTVAQRFGSPDKGTVIWDETNGMPQVFQGTDWFAIPAASPSGGVTAAIRNLVSGYDGYKAVTIAPDSAVAQALTNQRFVGVAFIVDREMSVSSVGYFLNVVGTGGNNWNGFGLYQMTSSGGWTFLQDTGSTDTAIWTGSTGLRTKALGGSVTLYPGRVYVLSLIASTAGTLAQIAQSSGSNGVATLGASVGLRVSGRSSVTSRQNSDQTAGNVSTTFGNMPFLGLL